MLDNIQILGYQPRSPQPESPVEALGSCATNIHVIWISSFGCSIKVTSPLGLGHRTGGWKSMERNLPNEVSCVGLVSGLAQPLLALLSSVCDNTACTHVNPQTAMLSKAKDDNLHI